MVENVVDEIVGVLKAKLPAQTAAASLPAVLNYLIAEEDIPPARLPAIFVLAQETQESNNLNSQLHDELHSVLIVVLHQHIDTQKLVRELWAYKNAVRRVIMRDLPQSPTQVIFDRRIVRHAYSRTREIEEGGAYSREVHLDCRFRERVQEQ